MYGVPMTLIIAGTILLWIFIGAGISLFITHLILKKYINAEETPCSIYEYSTEDINYSRKQDQVLDTEEKDLMYCYGNDPYEGTKHSIPEQLLKNGEEL